MQIEMVMFLVLVPLNVHVKGVNLRHKDLYPFVRFNVYFNIFMKRNTPYPRVKCSCGQ